MFYTTLRTVISSTTSSIFFKSIYIIHTEIIYILLLLILCCCLLLCCKTIGQKQQSNSNKSPDTLSWRYVEGTVYSDVGADIADAALCEPNIWDSDPPF